MKRFLASGFGVGLFWKTYFGDKKGGGTLASFLFALITYIFNLNVLELPIVSHYFTTQGQLSGCPTQPSE